jgi:hypothetical protein
MTLAADTSSDVSPRDPETRRELDESLQKTDSQTAAEYVSPVSNPIDLHPSWKEASLTESRY